MHFDLVQGDPGINNGALLETLATQEVVANGYSLRSWCCALCMTVHPFEEHAREGVHYLHKLIANGTLLDIEPMMRIRHTC